MKSRSTRSTQESPILWAQHLTLSFGGLRAVNDVTIELFRGELHGLIGPNGAGKTTIFNLMTGVYRPDSGHVQLAGRKVDGQKPSAIAKAGMSRTFQNIRLFSELTVLDNVLVAASLRASTGLFRALLRTPMAVAEERAMRERAMELLALVGIADVADEQAKNLPYGKQRKLEIARALATEPKVLLLDEPVAGMNTQEKREMRGMISMLREQFAVAILLIEHDMGLVMDICDRITVLDHGEVIASGSPREIQSNPKVISAYLGTSESEAAAASSATLPRVTIPPTAK